MVPRTYDLPPKRVNAAARRKLRRLMAQAKKRNDLKRWARARAVLGCIEGRTGADMAQELGVDRSTVARLLAAYAARGMPALNPVKPPGPQPKLAEEQFRHLSEIIEQGPQAAGFASGVWTGRLVAEYIRRDFRVEYNWKYIPELLHRLGFSVQRPRKQLSRADRKAQEYWLRHTFPALKKRPGGYARSSSSKTKPAFNSTPPCTAPGLE
jgi:transposase